MYILESHHIQTTIFSILSIYCVAIVFLMIIVNDLVE